MTSHLVLGSMPCYLHRPMYEDRPSRFAPRVVRVGLKGRVDEGLEEEVVKLVKNVPGVTDVTTDFYSVPPDAFLGP